MTLSATMRLAIVSLLAAASAMAKADTLMDIYQLAVASDPQLRQAEATYHAVAESKNQARAQLLPQLSLDANLIRDRQDYTSITGSPFPFQPYTSYSTTKSYDLTLSQALYHRDFFTQLREADAATAQAAASYQAAQEDLVVRAVNRYFLVLSATDNLSFSQAEKKANQRLLEQAKQRFDVGLIAITDVNEAQAAYDLSVAQEINNVNQLAIAKEELREVTGKFHESLQPLKDGITLPTPNPDNVDKWVDTALQQNYQLLAAQAAVDKAKQEVELNRSGHYPKLDAIASYGYSDIGGSLFGGSESNDSRIGLQFSLPLYQGGGVTSRVQAAQFNLTASKEALEQQRRSTDRQTRNAYLTVIDSINSVNALKQALVSTQSALDATQAGYEVGTRTIVDVLQSQSSVFDAQRNYAQARYKYVVSSLQLKQAAGVLKVSDVEEINRWLK
jgi:outer membrane protein